MAINFYKMCGAGNDFIVLDNRDKKLRNLAKLAQDVCPRRFAVGADGLLVMEKSQKFDIQMRIINADGSEAEMCGNGARCAALYSHEVLGLGKKFIMETLAGPIEAEIKKGKQKVRLSDPKDFRDLAPIEVDDGIFYFYSINTGVPHVVIFEESIDDFDVEKFGREVRHHPHFAPKGTNVNFAEIVDPGLVRVRTYERGVEGETLACGTGSTAVAICSVLIGKCSLPVTVQTESGDHLTVSFEHDKFEVKNVYLEGSAKFAYQGKIN